MLTHKLMGSALYYRKPYTLDSPRYLSSLGNGLSSTNTTGVMFTPDGLTMVFVLHNIANNNDDIFKEYNLSTAWDISTATASGRTFVLDAHNPAGAQFLDSGSKVVNVSSSGKVIYSYALSTAYDITTGATAVASPAWTPANMQGLHIVEKATSDVYMCDPGGAEVEQWSMTGTNVSTLSYVRSYSISEDTKPRGVAMNPDQTKMFVSGNTNNRVYQYSLSTAGNISTATYDNLSFNTQYLGSAGEKGPFDIAFGDNGRYLYVCGFNKGISQFSL